MGTRKLGRWGVSGLSRGPPESPVGLILPRFPEQAALVLGESQLSFPGDKPRWGVEGAGGQENRVGTGCPCRGSSGLGSGAQRRPAAQAAPRPHGALASASRGQSANKVPAAALPDTSTALPLAKHLPCGKPKGGAAPREPPFCPTPERGKWHECGRLHVDGFGMSTSHRPGVLEATPSASRTPPRRITPRTPGKRSSRGQLVTLPSVPSRLEQHQQSGSF